MSKYILIICLVIFGMGCSGKVPEQKDFVEMEKLSSKNIHPFLYYIIDVQKDKGPTYTAIVEGKELIRLLNNNAIDTSLIVEEKTLLKVNEAQIQEKYRVDFDLVNLILKEDNKQSFLNSYAPKGFINGFDNKMENAIMYVAIKKWKLTCLKDDETGFVVITK